jgi:hypothetical protein
MNANVPLSKEVEVVAMRPVPMSAMGKNCRFLSGFAVLLVLVLVMLWAGAFSCQAGSFVWTNSSGGTWSDSNSWSPNSVPSTGDDAFITNNGTYDVSLDTSVTVDSLTIGGTNGTQTFHTGASTLNVNEFCTVNTNGAFDLEGGAFSGPGSLTVSGVFTWTGGVLASGGPETAVSVTPTGLMVLSEGLDTLDGSLTNAGTMELINANLEMQGTCYDSSGMLVNLAGGVVDFQGDVGVLSLCGTEAITNFGTVVKTGGFGVSTISSPFYNAGVLDVESGAINLASTYSLTNGRVNIGIGSLDGYGVLELSGNPALLGGTLSATLTGDYQPIATNVFPVVTYESAIGGFARTNLPYIDAWGTNYGPTDFSLIVSNARPLYPSVPTQSVEEFSTLSVTANATDADVPAQMLTYSLTTAPTGMTINPSTGAISWTPAQTQSPSTNVVTVSVTDNGTPPLATNTTFKVVVVEQNRPPIWPVIGTVTVNEASLLTVNVAAQDTNIHATIIGYGLLKAPAGLSISSNGVVTWTPNPSQSPSTNTIITIVTNSDPLDTVNPTLTSMMRFTVVVFAPTLAPIPDYSVSVGQTLTFTNIAADNDATRTLTFALLNGPESATLDSATGVFAWQPASSFAGTFNPVTIQVSDNNVPPLSATQSFTVAVNTLSTQPALGAVRFSGGQFQFDVNGPAGAVYVIEATASLGAAEWTVVQTITPTAVPFTFVDTNSPGTGRFYRVELGQ